MRDVINQHGVQAAGVRKTRGGRTPARGSFGATVLLASLSLIVCVAMRARQDTAQVERVPADDRPPVFTWLDVYVDSGDAPLAAYQFELHAETGTFKIVGVEGGEHAAFAEPPFYDSAALRQDRIIIGDFTLDEDLPSGNTRVARVHVMISGDIRPAFVVDLMVAVSPDAMDVDAVATVVAADAE